MGEGQNDAVTPARTFATLVGGALILFGLSGFFYSSSFATGDTLVAAKAFGLFYVNGWQNLLHIAAGMLGLAMAMRLARVYCLASGLVWAVLACGGFFGAHGGEDVPAMGGLIPAGTANDILNLILAGLAFAAAAASVNAPVAGADSASTKKVPPRREKASSEAEKPSKPKAKLEPQASGGIGRPRSAGRVQRPKRGPIN